MTAVGGDYGKNVQDDERSGRITFTLDGMQPSIG
jgi:hypothetical protein